MGSPPARPSGVCGERQLPREIQVLKNRSCKAEGWISKNLSRVDIVATYCGSASVGPPARADRTGRAGGPCSYNSRFLKLAFSRAAAAPRTHRSGVADGLARGRAGTPFYDAFVYFYLTFCDCCLRVYRHWKVPHCFMRQISRGMR